MKNIILFASLCMLSSVTFAHDSVSVSMVDLNSGKKLGNVTISYNKYGTVFSPNLSGMPPGMHGFHLHANGSCKSATKNGKRVLGGAAGGHYDPKKTGKHGFPWSENNHLGDLPGLYVDKKGRATTPVLAPRVRLRDVDGLALMVHAGGDNHSDRPKKLGGGGARIACGVIK